MTTPVIELTDVSRDYGEVRALREVTLSIHAGELLAVVGPSGSGKSTLLQLMGTLDRPSTGTVRVHGHDVLALPDRWLSAVRARWIGFVFQQFFLTPYLSAVENVANGLFYHGLRRSVRLRLAEQSLRQVGLGHRVSHRPQELSGGERQRVAIARALVARPSILLADEPTGALDSRSGEEVMALLRELNGDGTTIAVITHDRALAADMPRQVQLFDGRISQDTAAVVVR
ncbi:MULTISPECIES: ABC transporter ATP-binding protein [Amycolatopsis]|uniref:ABC transporter ATP-binding protein n=2 Tax=Amycolatopsis TaxID=1813 RepID=A0ABP9QPC5_9PSEU|nr:ABC transporter ATP-binding protein [Amycolatopsis sacchari]SFK08698.1 putative ABC transport system ATP-binding protein [Amycolatopsis sacchari]